MRMWNDVTALENNMAVPQKIVLWITCDPAVPLLGIYPKELKAGTLIDICALIFIAALFTIPIRWKELHWWMKVYIKCGIYLSGNII